MTHPINSFPNFWYTTMKIPVIRTDLGHRIFNLESPQKINVN